MTTTRATRDPVREASGSSRRAADLTREASGPALYEAHKLMRDHQIRHLPIRHGGKLVGMLSERDLRLVESFKDVDPRTLPIADAMSQYVSR